MFERKIKANDHSAGDIDRKGDPRTADRLPAALVYDDLINGRMINLNNLKRVGGLIGSDYRSK